MSNLENEIDCDDKLNSTTFKLCCPDYFADYGWVKSNSYS